MPRGLDLKLKALIEMFDEVPIAKKLQSSVAWKNNFLLCGKPAIIDAHHPPR